MSDKKYEPLEINIKVNSPGGLNFPGHTSDSKIQKKQLDEAMEKVGKHGKSHHLYMKIMGQQKPPQMRKISMDELSEHNKQDSAWLSLNGIVYDVSVYLHYHPGGDIILKGCGKDASSLFYQYHPWVNAKHLLQNYAIGYLTHN